MLFHDRECVSVGICFGAFDWLTCDTLVAPPTNHKIQGKERYYSIVKRISHQKEWEYGATCLR